MSQHKAGAIVIGWIVGFVASIALAPFYTIFAGVAAGALLTAVVFGLAIRWSMRGMVDDVTEEIETVQENLEPDLPDTEDRQ